MKKQCRLKKWFSVIFTLYYVLRLYIRNAPIKLFVECLIDAMRKIMIVITSVWMLEYLMELILEEASFNNGIMLLGVVTIGNVVVDLIQKFYLNCIKPQSDLKIRTHLEGIILEKAKKLPIRCYENSEFYTIVQQSQDGLMSVFSVYSEFINTFGNLLALISAIKVLMDIEAFLLIFVMFTIPMIIISKKRGKCFASKEKAMKYWQRKKNYAREVWLQKNYIREFKTTNASTIPDKHYEEGYNGAIMIHSSFGKRIFLLDVFGEFFSIKAISVSSYLYCIIRFAYSDLFDVSIVSVILVAIMNVISKIQKIYQSYGKIYECQTRLMVLKDYLDYEQEDENEDGLIPDDFEILEFDNVSFSYNKEKMALKDVSFKIEAGEKVSIVGYNGAGKSTLIKLILRFYDVDSGQILYNGVDIKEYRLSEYRNKFFAAFQDYQLFSVSLAENILMSKYILEKKNEVDNLLTDIDMEELIGYEECLLGREYDKDGLELSGGQRQKIAISRFNFTSYDVAIFDEPTAALDPISADKIFRDVTCKNRDRTMLLVSHDMSCSKFADQILFFEDGELLEKGTHIELIEKNQQYAAFFKCQAEAYREV